MIRKIFFLLIVLILTLEGRAQSDYLNQIEQNSLTLKALREQINVEKIANKSGLLPSNPSIEFNYLWGSPTAIGNRKDFAVSQEFDFPTAYIYKADRAEQLNVNAELRYKSERIQILLQAKELISRVIYFNALIELYTTRVVSAEKLLDSYRMRFEKGESNILELNKSELNYNSVSVRLAQINVERVDALAKLQQLNGGVSININENTYVYEPLPASFKDWYELIEAKNPMLQYVKGNIKINEMQIKAERAMTLPKFSAGYMSESVVGQDYRGVSVGISIPLWENKNRVKHAKADLELAQTIASDTRVAFYNSLQSLFSNAQVLQKSVNITTKSLEALANEELLKKALDYGEISLITYLQELDYYYNVREEFLNTQLELELNLVRLFAVEL